MENLYYSKGLYYNKKLRKYFTKYKKKELDYKILYVHIPLIDKPRNNKEITENIKERECSLEITQSIDPKAFFKNKIILQISDFEYISELNILLFSDNNKTLFIF